jgi:hypothetical protein
MNICLVGHELVKGGAGRQGHLAALGIVLRVVAQVLPSYPILVPEITNKELSTEGNDKKNPPPPQQTMRIHWPRLRFSGTCA